MSKGKYSQIAITALVEYKNNARTHSPEQVEKICKSIQEFGFINPVLINKDNVIIAGHGRVMAAKKLGMETVPCLRVEHLTDEQMRAYVIADNKLAEEAGWDMEMLRNELQSLSDMDFDISLTGFDSFESIDIELKDYGEVTEDEYKPVVPEEAKAKLGDIYQLGNHRLMCGDSTSATDIDKLLGGAKVDLVFTDPPYGMKKEAKGVANDNLNFDDLLEFNKRWIPLTFNALKDNGSWYCWGIDEPLMDIYSNILKPMAKNNEISIQNYITWDKGTGQGQLSSEMRSYAKVTEKCWFVIRGVQGYNNNSDNYFEGFEPIRKYLEEECNKCGGHKIWKEMLQNDMGKHYFTKSQWLFPTKDAYKKMQAYGQGKGAFKKDYEALKKDYEALKKEFYATRAYFDNTHDNMNDVWHFDRVSGEEKESVGGHATPKPIALCSRAIKSSSRENENVLDVFGGSGSTLITCEQLNRNAYIMELEPKWVDVIIDRWEQYTGQKAVLL